MNDIYPWHLPSLKQWHQTITSNRLTPVTILRHRDGYADTQLVEQMTQRILCDNPTVDGLPCQHCQHCNWIRETSHVNVTTANAEDKVSIDDVRKLEHEIWQTGSFGKPKVVNLFKLDLLSLNAQSALLKTLEEPPENTYFVLTADNMGDVLPTVISRARRLAHPRDPENTLWQDWVKHKTGISDDALATYFDESDISPLALLEYVNDQSKLGELDQARNEYKIFLTGKLTANGYAKFLNESDLADALVHTLNLTDNVIKKLFHHNEQPIKTVWGKVTTIKQLYELRDILGKLIALSKTNCDLYLQVQSELNTWNYERRR